MITVALALLSPPSKADTIPSLALARLSQEFVPLVNLALPTCPRTPLLLGRFLLAPLVQLAITRSPTMVLVPLIPVPLIPSRVVASTPSPLILLFAVTNALEDGPSPATEVLTRSAEFVPRSLGLTQHLPSPLEAIGVYQGQAFILS